MTDLLTTEHADSGDILRLNPSIVETHRLDVGEHTRRLPVYARKLPPLHALRRPDATGEHPLYQPQTIAIVGLQEPPIAPPPPAPRVPVAATYSAPVVRERPAGYRGVRRRAVEPRPVWAVLVIGFGLGTVGTVVPELAGITVLVVWR